MNIKLLMGIIVSTMILFIVMWNTSNIILNNNEEDFTMTILLNETQRELEFDGCDDYIGISPPVELLEDNVPIVAYVNLDAVIKNTTSQKDNNGVEYFVNTIIKADGWHLVSTDIFNTIYSDGAPIARRMNQPPPVYRRFIGNDVGDGVNIEYTIIDTGSEQLTFKTGNWIHFDGDWTKIELYIGDLKPSDDCSEELVRTRALNFVEIQYLHSVWNGSIDEINIHPVVNLE